MSKYKVREIHKYSITALRGTNLTLAVYEM